jgi:hypothetical protein
MYMESVAKIGTIGCNNFPLIFYGLYTTFCSSQQSSCFDALPYPVLRSFRMIFWIRRWLHQAFAKESSFP